MNYPKPEPLKQQKHKKKKKNKISKVKHKMQEGPNPNHLQDLLFNQEQVGQNFPNYRNNPLNIRVNNDQV
jgi:hypothetical protein